MKLFYIYTKEYCSCVKKKIMKIVGKWIELETVISREVTEIQERQMWLGSCYLWLLALSLLIYVCYLGQV